MFNLLLLGIRIYSLFNPISYKNLPLDCDTSNMNCFHLHQHGFLGTLGENKIQTSIEKWVLDNSGVIMTNFKSNPLDESKHFIEAEFVSKLFGITERVIIEIHLMKDDRVTVEYHSESPFLSEQLGLRGKQFFTYLSWNHEKDPISAVI